MHYHIAQCQSLCSRVYEAAQFKKSYQLLLVSLSWISKQILVSISSHTEKTNTFVVLNSFSIANPHWLNLKLALNYIKHQMTAIASFANIKKEWGCLNVKMSKENSLSTIYLLYIYLVWAIIINKHIHQNLTFMSELLLC